VFVSTIDSVVLMAGSTNLMDGLEDLPPGIGQYDDFHTIDWLRDISRDRMRHRHIVRRRQEGCFERLKGAHDAWSGWVCVLLVGCAAGSSLNTHSLYSGLSRLMRARSSGNRRIAETRKVMRLCHNELLDDAETTVCSVCCQWQPETLGCR